MVETINKLVRIERQLVQELGREPTNEEISEQMGIEVDKVNEIRKAIYHSEVTQIVDKFIKEKIGNDDINEDYLKFFSENDIKHFNDYGRFYRSIAFFYNTDVELRIVKNYNSRPKQMIDNMLQSFQKKKEIVKPDDIKQILNNTIALMEILEENKNKEYLIDACIPFSLSNWEKLKSKIKTITEDIDMEKTFEKSKATTSNVNKRVSIVYDILNGSV